jgi:hypothetical protein
MGDAFSPIIRRGNSDSEPTGSDQVDPWGKLSAVPRGRTHIRFRGQRLNLLDQGRPLALEPRSLERSLRDLSRVIELSKPLADPFPRDRRTSRLVHHAVAGIDNT